MAPPSTRVARPLVTKTSHPSVSRIAERPPSDPVRLRLALVGLTIVTFLVGYADLVRGGLTLGPIALTVAYCALVPTCIWYWRRGSLGGGPSTAPYREAGVVGLGVLLLYAVTLSPTTAMWDASEYIAAAHTVGTPHPPGNPLFVLIGRSFALLPIAPTVAQRVNLLAALSSAAAAAIWFLVADRALATLMPIRAVRLVAAAAGTLAGATAFTVWNQSVVNEKVYTLSLVGIAISSWLLLRWADDPSARRADLLLVLASYLTGLGYANQMSAFLVVPAGIVLVAAVRPRSFLRAGLVGACVVAMAGGLTVFATQPIRAAFGPAINEGEPTACTDGKGFRLDCTLTETTWRRFKYNFDREQYAKPPLAQRQAPFSAQLGMWWLYFKWQWLRDPHVERPALQHALALTFLGLGLLGAAAHFRADRRSFAYVGSLAVTTSILLVYYMNFEYGHSQAPELGEAVPREVRDRDYFFIWSYSLWGVWIAVGVARIWSTVATALASRGSSGSAGRASAPWVAASPVVFIALLPLVTNWSTASRRGQTDARDFAHDLLNSVEPYAILITAGDNDTFPLWYAQEVEGVRRDVLVVNNTLLNTDWHLRHLIRRRTFAFDRTRAPRLFARLEARHPDAPALTMSLAEGDSIPPYVLLDQPMTFRAGALTATLGPESLPGAGEGRTFLERSDVVVLRLIADNWNRRPIYFSRTAGGQSRRLGLAGYLVTQGFVDRVNPGPVATQAGRFRTGDGWYDLERSTQLWTTVYRGGPALAARRDWVDRASVNIPYLYVATGAQLATAQHAVGDEPGGRRTLALTRRVARAMRLERELEDLVAMR